MTSVTPVSGMPQYSMNTQAYPSVPRCAPATTCAPVCTPKPVTTCTTKPVTTCTTVPATTCATTGNNYSSMEKWGTYAGYGGMGIGVIVFILLVIAVIVLWIRMNHMTNDSRELLTYKYNGESKDFYLPNENRNILFINNTCHCVNLYVSPKDKDSSQNNNNNCLSGEILVVKNMKCNGRTKIVPTNGLTYNSGGIEECDLVEGTIASQFSWLGTNELLRLT